jgi:hypothetical protein
MQIRALVVRRVIAAVAALFVIAVGSSLIAGPSGATPSTVYVSPAGADTNPGTLAAPWRTVAHALSALNPGDTLYVRGGTYVENITGTSVRPGTASAPILVTNYPGERPVIEGLLWLRSPSYWTFDGINVTWNPANGSTSHMVKFTDGVGWTLRNGELWGAHSYAALLVAGDVTGQPASWTVANNCIHDTYASNDVNQDHLIYANTGTSPGSGVIARNILFNATNGEAVKLGGASQTSGAGANVTVDSNTMYNTAQNVLIGWQSHDNAVTHNLMDKTSGSYGNVRGYQLSGANNIAASNLGYQASKLILNDAGYPGVADAGGNQFPVNPQFDNVTSCTGFHPGNPAAAGFGRYAGGNTPPAGGGSGAGSGSGGGSGSGSGGGSSTTTTPPTTTPPPTTAPPTTTPPTTQPPAPAPGSNQFSDGFESGTFGQWTSTGPGMTVQQQLVSSGAWAARATCSGASAYAYKLLAKPLSDITFETHFNVDSRGAATFSLARLATASAQPMAALMVTKTGQLTYYNSATQRSLKGPVVTSNAWHDLKVHVTVKGASSTVAVWLDGVAVPTMTTTDSLGTTPVGRTYIGDPATGGTFDVAFDDVSVSGNI